MIAFDPRVVNFIIRVRKKRVPFNATMKGLNRLWPSRTCGHNDTKPRRRCCEHNDRPSLHHFRRRETSDAGWDCSNEIAAENRSNGRRILNSHANDVRRLSLSTPPPASFADGDGATSKEEHRTDADAFGRLKSSVIGEVDGWEFLATDFEPGGPRLLRPTICRNAAPEQAFPLLRGLLPTS